MRFHQPIAPPGKEQSNSCKSLGQDFWSSQDARVGTVRSPVTGVYGNALSSSEHPEIFSANTDDCVGSLAAGLINRKPVWIPTLMHRERGTWESSQQQVCHASDTSLASTQNCPCLTLSDTAFAFAPWRSGYLGLTEPGAAVLSKMYGSSNGAWQRILKGQRWWDCIVSRTKQRI